MQSHNVNSSRLEVTLIGQSPDDESLLSETAPAAHVELVAGSGPGMETETQTLLRNRLRAAAIVLLAGVGSFFVRSFLVEDAPARGAQIAVSVLLAAVIGSLTARRSFTLPQLRLTEYGVFGMMIAYLGYYEYRLVLMKAVEGNPVYELAAVKSCVLYFFAVILLYGTFIPNTWQRATRVVIPLMVTPLIVMGLLRLRSTAVAEIAAEVANFEQVSDNVIMLTLGGVASLYGTHIINSLRVEAFQA